MNAQHGSSSGSPHPRSSATYGTGSPGGLPRPRVRTIIASVVGIVLAGVGMAGLSPASAATVTGTLVAQGLTRPDGGAFLSGGGGHFWVADGSLGLCDTLPAAASVTKCNGTAQGGQVVVASATRLV